MNFSKNKISDLIQIIQDSKEIISEIYSPYTQTAIDMFKKGNKIKIKNRIKVNLQSIVMEKLPLNVYREERIALIQRLEREQRLQLMLDSGIINYKLICIYVWKFIYNILRY